MDYRYFLLSLPWELFDQVFNGVSFNHNESVLCDVLDEDER